MNSSRILGDVAADRARRPLDLLAPRRSDLAGADRRCCRPPSAARPRSGKPASARAWRARVQVDRLATSGTREPPAGELDPEVRAADGDAGDAATIQRRQRQPQPPAAHGVRFGPRVASQPASRPPPSRPSRPGRRRTAAARVTSSTSTRVTTRAVNIDTRTPTDRVTPNPRTAPEARKNSRPAASRVVTLESAMALTRLW